MDVNSVLQQVDEFYARSEGPKAEILMCSAIKEAVEEQDNEGLLQLLNELLGYYRETSQVEQSYKIAEQIIALAIRMGLENTIPYATCLLNVANAYRAGGRLADSLACYEKVRVIYSANLAKDNMLIASMENNLSLLYQEMGVFDKAKESLLRALPIVSSKKADFEVAVTYANLAGTCMQLGEAEEAYRYGQLAVKAFETMGVQDAHYGAALSALGMYFFGREDYGLAFEHFAKAQSIMEQNLGRNEYYHRLGENMEKCRERMEESGKPCADTAECPVEKGLDLCREYYEIFVRPMIEGKFPKYAGKIAIGLVGEGSDCFKYDDKLSRDHDWGPDLCMWVTEDTYKQIGTDLQEAYGQLPKEYKGFQRTVTPQGAGRRGVRTIEDFYGKLLGFTMTSVVQGEKADDTEILSRLDWTAVPDYALAAAVNGEVFRDDEGIFTAVRERLLAGYPEHILYRKLAESCAKFAQAAQYNYSRCMERGDELTARIMLMDGVREAMKLKHYIEKKYPPHDKWLKRSLEDLRGGKELALLLEKLSEKVAEQEKAAEQEKVTEQIEEIARHLATDLYAHHYISDVESYLGVHTEELLVKASLAELTTETIVDKIVRLEFSAFDKVQNVGGRASCQNDWPTFYVMRKSQYLTWNRTMLMQYYYDFQREYNLGHNLIEEKYGRMMESTAPREYEAIKEHFPYISPGKQAVIEQIVALQVDWMEAFAEKYPRMAENARSVRTAEDNLYNTSYETYLRGEISTYSDKMLELYGRYVVEYAGEGRNLAYEIMSNSARMYGYRDVDAAEQSM